MIAPHDRSIPAVRITIVCPTASVPTTATCCRISEMLPGVRNRSESNANTITDTSSTTAGPIVACACSRCCTRVSTERSRSSTTAVIA